MTYECDMHTFYKGAPDAVVLPAAGGAGAGGRASSAAAARVADRAARIGDGLDRRRHGGPGRRDGVDDAHERRCSTSISPNRCATVQPGLINLWLTHAVAERGWFFAPDPSSQMVSSHRRQRRRPTPGGPHCLKYGITTNHVLGLEMVTGAGELVRLGGKVAERPGYDLTGAAVGSEGTFGLVTAITVRLHAHTGGGQDGPGRVPLRWSTPRRPCRRSSPPG